MKVQTHGPGVETYSVRVETHGMGVETSGTVNLENSLKKETGSKNEKNYGMGRKQCEMKK